MSDLKPKGIKIKLGNNEYGMRFTLNAIDDIQEKFKIPAEKIGELLEDETNKIRNVRYLLMLLINEDIDCVKDDTGIDVKHVDERYVGRHIDGTNMHSIMGDIMRSFSGGAPETDDDEVPNVPSE